MLLVIASGHAASAQDRIYAWRGKVMEGRVKSVGKFWVKYYVYTGEDTILRHKDLHYIDSIAYGDGHVWRKRKTKADVARENKAARDRRAANQLKGFPNALTVDIMYMDIADYPGIVLGFSYDRFLDKKGKFSVSMSGGRSWAGTTAYGKLNSGEVRANIQCGYVMPAFLYHTAKAGNATYIDLSFGAAFPFGTIRRYDVTGGPSSNSNTYTLPTTNTLAAALLQANFCLHLGGHFIFTTTLSGGPMLDAANTRGSLWLAGFKFGGRF